MKMVRTKSRGIGQPCPCWGSKRKTLGEHLEACTVWVLVNLGQESLSVVWCVAWSLGNDITMKNDYLHNLLCKVDLLLWLWKPQRQLWLDEAVASLGFPACHGSTAVRHEAMAKSLVALCGRSLASEHFGLLVWNEEIKDGTKVDIRQDSVVS